MNAPREPFDPRPAARMLGGAWRSGEQLIELPAAMRPVTLDEGYQLQDHLIAAMGEAPMGWKLGVGSPAAMRKAGIARPLVGRLFESRFHGDDAVVDVPQQGAVTVEFEIAFVLARDIAPNEAAALATLASPASAASASSLASVIAETRCTFELVRSRFVDRRAVGWPSFAGDSVGFEALVIGAPVAFDDIARIGAECVVERNGHEAARGLHGDDRTDPLASLGALLAHAGERGITLKRGEIVTTGAAAQPFDIAASARIEARWGGGTLAAQVVFGR